MGIRTVNASDRPSDNGRYHLKLVTPLWPKLVKVVDENVELSCCIDGQPISHIEWRHNNQSLPSNSSRIKFRNDNQTLVIRRITLDDAGIYECFARNGAGSLVTACELTVEENPRSQRPRILQELSDLTVHENGEVGLTCIATSTSLGTEAFGWFKDGQVVNEDERHVWIESSLPNNLKQYTLKLSGSKISDSGVYECRIISFFGGPVSTFAQVQVM